MIFYNHREEITQKQNTNKGRFWTQAEPPLCVYVKKYAGLCGNVCKFFRNLLGYNEMRCIILDLN